MSPIPMMLFTLLSLAPSDETRVASSVRPTPSETIKAPERALSTDEGLDLEHRQVDSLYAREDRPSSPAQNHLAPGWKMRPRGLNLQSAMWPPLMALCACFAAALVVQNRKLRRQLMQSGSNDTSIEILAVKSFGLRHRLALIATCGERMLISASDREVSLLSHLTPSAAGDDVDATETPVLASTENEKATPLISSEKTPATQTPQVAAQSVERVPAASKKSGRRKKAVAAVEAATIDEEDRAFTLDDLESATAEERELSPRTRSRRKDADKEERPRRNATFSSDVAGLARWKAQKNDVQPGQGA